MPSYLLSLEQSMKMRGMWALWCAVVLCASGARAADVIRYNLPVGTQLIYSVHIENAVNQRTSAFDGRWEFTVLKETPDGWRHIAAIKVTSITSMITGQTRTSPES